MLPARRAALAARCRSERSIPLAAACPGSDSVAAGGATHRRRPRLPCPARPVTARARARACQDRTQGECAPRIRRTQKTRRRAGGRVRTGGAETGLADGPYRQHGCVDWPVQAERRSKRGYRWCRETRTEVVRVGNWQPRMDSNHRMPESESGALPLGDGAVDCKLYTTLRAACQPVRAAARTRGVRRPGGPQCAEATCRTVDGRCARPAGTPAVQQSAMDQRLEYCVARRALCRPTFLRSTSRASRVMKPALRSSDFRVSSYSTSARAMPRRMAPA